MLSEFSKKLIIGFVLAFIMITSAFGVLFYGFNEGQKTLTYGDYVFKGVNSQWQTTINKQKLSFTYFPGDIDFITVPPDTKVTMMNARLLFFTSDINATSKEAIAGAQFKLKNYLDQRRTFVVPAFTTATGFNLPIITCENGTSSQQVILFQDGRNTTISQKGNCIIFEGDSYYSFDKLAERIIYMFSGVIP